MQETPEMWVQSLGWEDLLKEDMATHSSILAWKILWTEKPGVLQSTGSPRVRQDCATEHTNQNSNMVSWYKDIAGINENM